MRNIRIVRPLVPDEEKFFGYLREIFDSRVFSNNGPFLLRLEERIKEYLGAANGAAFCNGTVALMVALRGLELSGKVIVTPFTFPATVNALQWAGLEPVFCDVDTETMNITPETVAKALTPDVSGILPVHVFGNPCDVVGFGALAEERGLKVIYDAAHAFGVEINGEPIGNFGDITMFSFHPTKLFHTGEGGFLTYKDSVLDGPIKQLRNFGIESDEVGTTMNGLNGKMNEIQAALGLCLIDQVEKERYGRMIISAMYVNFLQDVRGVKILHIPQNVRRSWQYFPICLPNRNYIFEELKKNGVFARKYFYPLCNEFKHFKGSVENTPNAKDISNTILCLPLYGDLGIRDVEFICDIIARGA